MVVLGVGPRKPPASESPESKMSYQTVPPGHLRACRVGSNLTARTSNVTARMSRLGSAPENGPGGQKGPNARDPGC
jgi:hypothetical protein